MSENLYKDRIEDMLTSVYNTFKDCGDTLLSSTAIFKSSFFANQQTLEYKRNATRIVL